MELKNNSKNKAIKLVFALVLTLLLTLALAYAIPQTFNINGKLTDSSGTAVEGTNNMTFRIYSNYSATISQALFTAANQSVTTDSDGIYHFILKDINLTFSDQYFLGIEVATDGEMSPRLNLTTSPYAFRANVTDYLDPAKNYDIQNITLGEKITFTLGEVIDNLVDGIIRITGDLNITGGLNVSGGANISGNLGVSGTVTANAFAGDGSALTGIASDTEFDNATIVRSHNTSWKVNNATQADTASDLVCTDCIGATEITDDYVLNTGDTIDGSLIINGNLTIIGAEITANVTNQRLNGSFLPQLDATFNIGSGSSRWKDSNFSGSLSANRLSDGTAIITGGAITGASMSADQIAAGALDIGGNTLTVNSIEIVGSDGEVNDAAIEATITRDSELANGSIVRSQNTSFVTDNAYDTAAEVYTATPHTNRTNADIATVMQNFSIVRSYNTSWITENAAGMTNGTDINQTRAYIGKLEVYGDSNHTFDGTTLVVDSTNNLVGIGTTSPQQELHIQESANEFGAQGRSESSIIIEGSGQFLQFMSDNNSVAGFFWNEGEDEDGAQFRYSYDNTSSSGKFEFRAGASEVMRIESDGDVGIGTTSPSYPLHIKDSDSGDSSNFVITADDDGLVHLFAKDASDDAYYYMYDGDGNADIVFNTGGNSYINNGNVGIGTASPAHKLEVAGSMNISGDLNVSGTITGDGSGLTGVSASMTNNTDINQTRAYIGKLEVYGDSNHTFDGTTLVVDSTNNGVGIGTTAPDATLHVVDSAGIATMHVEGTGQRASLEVDSSDDDTIIAFQENDNSEFTIMHDQSESLFQFKDGSSSGVAFMTVEDGADANTLYLDINGNVGIGTTSPAHKLEVSGSMNISGDLNVSGTITGDGSGLTGVSASMTNGTDINETRAYIGKLEVYGANNHTFDGNTLAIDSTNSRVGIGTTSPAAVLHVQGSATQLLVTELGNNAPIKVQIGNDTSDDVYTNYQTDGNNFSVGIDRGLGNDYLIAEGSALSGGTARLLIEKTTGNVGIGTTSPAHKLEVSGSMNISGNLNVSKGVNLAVDSGNVGIGNNTPNRLLHLYQDSNDLTANSALRIQNVHADGDAYMYLGIPSQDWSMGIDNSNNDNLVFVAANDVSDADGKMVIQPGGNVGIGTTSPANELHVSGTTFLEGTTSLKIGRDTLDNITFGIDNSPFAQTLVMKGDTTDVGFSFEDSSGTERMVINVSSGNVGIGTTAPAHKLEVAGSMNVSGDLNVSGTITGDGSGLTGVSASMTNNTDINQTNAYIGKLEVYGSNNHTFDGTTLAVDSTNSRVGLGTTSPNTQLHIQTASRNTDFDAAVGSSWHDLVIMNPDGTRNSSAGIAFEISSAGYHTNAGTGIAAVKTVGDSDYGADMVFVTRPQSAAAVERMRITSTGNVGIGTTSPASLLHVENGNITIDTVTSGTSGITFRENDGESLHLMHDGDDNSLKITDNLNDAKVTFLRTGNVGIGTTTPSETLTVTGSTGVNITNTGAGYSFRVHDSAGDSTPFEITASGIVNVGAGAYIATDTIQQRGGSTDLTIQTESGTNKNIIISPDGTGNVGIGTTSPGVKLSVQGASGSDILNVSNGTVSALYADNSSRVGIGTTAPNANLHVGGSNAMGDATNPALQIGGTTGYRLGFYTEAELGIIDAANGDDGLAFHTKVASEAMRITSSGNVGIGTTTPSHKLVVNGTTEGLVLHPDGATPTINTTTSASTSNITITSSSGSVIIKLG